MTIRNDDVKTNDNNKKKLKFLFIGRTASGKSSIAKEVCRRLGLKQVKSYTTRPKREGETEENSAHYFVTKDDFEFIMSDSQVNNGIAAYTEINGYEYCTTIDILDDSDIYVIDPDGVEYLKNHCTNKYDFIEIMNCCGGAVGILSPLDEDWGRQCSHRSSDIQTGNTV